MTKNYVLKPIYNDENECVNDTLSGTMKVKRVKEGGEFSKPFPMSLLEAIERFLWRQQT